MRPAARSTNPTLRQYFSLRSDVIGPVFTQDLGYAGQRDHRADEARDRADVHRRHVTDITNAARVPSSSDISDFVVGGSTRFTYGLNNRFLYRGGPRRRSAADARVPDRRRAADVLLESGSASMTALPICRLDQPARPVDLSPIAVTARLSPTDRRRECSAGIRRQRCGAALLSAGGRRQWPTRRHDGKRQFSRSATRPRSN